MLTIVGMQYILPSWQGALSDSHLLDKEITLKKEANNKYDKNAIAVYSKNLKIGYIARDNQKEALTDNGINARYVITSVGFYTLNARRLYREN